MPGPLGMPPGGGAAKGPAGGVGPAAQGSSQSRCDLRTPNLHANCQSCRTSILIGRFTARVPAEERACMVQWLCHNEARCWRPATPCDTGCCGIISMKQIRYSSGQAARRTLHPQHHACSFARTSRRSSKRRPDTSWGRRSCSSSIT